MTTPVAVVMPCHNYGQWVEEAIRSVQAQTLPPAELLVIDDGSTDDSAQILDRLAAELSPALPLRVIHQPNAGLVATLNRAVRETTSPYVAFASADDVLLPTFLEHLVAALDDDAAAGFAYCKMELFGDETGVHLTYPFSAGRLIFDINYVAGASAVRRAAFDAAGGFRDLPGHEDWDLWLGFVAAGWRGRLVDEVLYRWRRHPTARNHAKMSDKALLRVRILLTRPRLLIRYSYLAIPWTLRGLWRRIRLRVPLPGRPAPVRGRSCWLEADVGAK
jgi:glycosyltransferase involved in cell wall biosynthesis